MNAIDKYKTKTAIILAIAASANFDLSFWTMPTSLQPLPIQSNTISISLSGLQILVSSIDGIVADNSFGINVAVGMNGIVVFAKRGSSAFPILVASHMFNDWSFVTIDFVASIPSLLVCVFDVHA